MNPSPEPSDGNSNVETSAPFPKEEHIEEGDGEGEEEGGDSEEMPLSSSNAQGEKRSPSSTNENPSQKKKPKNMKKKPKNKNKNAQNKSKKSPAKKVALQFYDMETELHILMDWFHLVESPLPETTALQKLREEANDTSDKEGSRMAEYLQRAEDSEVSEETLTAAECIAVAMFTDDNDRSAFYVEYNEQSMLKNWIPYQVYTSLLLSALGKLSKLRPVNDTMTVFRGLTVRVDPPATGTRLCFKTFSSSTKARKVAEDFAKENGTLLHLQLSAASSAANVGEISPYGENELLLLPFEVFEIVGVDGNNIFFKTAAFQDFAAAAAKSRPKPRVLSVRDLVSDDVDKIVLVRETADHLPSPLQDISDAVTAHLTSGVEEAIDIECPGVPSGRVIFAPTGPLTHTYSDVKLFQKAVFLGLQRAVETGSRAPLVVGLPHTSFDVASDVTLVGVLRALDEIIDTIEGRVIRSVAIFVDPGGAQDDILRFLEREDDDDDSEQRGAGPGAAAIQSEVCEDNVPGRRGIYNIGRKCFMIAIIQVLSKLSDVLTFFINRTAKTSDGPLVKAFSDLIGELWSRNESSPVKITLFTDIIMEMTEKRFDKKIDHDAGDFLECLLNALHHVLNEGFPQLSDPNQAISHTEKADFAWNKFLASNDSIISGTFNGLESSTIKCSECGNESRSFESFLILAIPIAQVKDESIFLEDCLGEYIKEETLDESNQRPCPVCTSASTKQIKLQKLPKVLVLQLKRFERNTDKISTSVVCPIVGLDMRPFVNPQKSELSNQTQETVYDLYGVVNHTLTASGGHYTAHIRHPLSGHWFFFDDHIVTAVNINALRWADAYIVFYQRRTSDDGQLMLGYEVTDCAGGNRMSVKINTVEDVEALSEDTEPVVFGFFESESLDEYRQFQKLANSLNGDVRFAYSFNADVLSKYKQKNTIVILRPHPLPEKIEPSRVVYSGDCTSLSDVTKWVSDNRHGLAGQRTSTNYHQFKNPLIVVYYDETRTKTVAQLNSLRERVMKAAKKFSDAGKKVQFAVSSAMVFEDDLNNLALTVADDPVVVATDRAGQRYVMIDRFSIIDLKKFADDLLAGKLQPCVRSQPVPESNDGAVKIVVRSTFNEIVNDTTKDVLIAFYTPCSSACKKLVSTLEKVALKLEDERDIVMCKINAEANDLPKSYKVNRYPAVFFAPKDCKDAPKAYKGSLTVDRLLKFVAKESSSPLKKYKRNGEVRSQKSRKD